MPVSDTWLGGIAVETEGGMDGAGSCDGSGVSDASLEHLSAEERECILFLEEMIESLETEEDSSPPSPEPEPHLPPRSLEQTIAYLSSPLPGSVSKEQHGDVNGKENGFVQGCPVLTPLGMKGNQLDTEPCTAPTLQSQLSCPGRNSSAVDRIKGSQARSKTGVSRGPLSHEGLVELRTKTSLKKHAQSGESNCSSHSPAMHACLNHTPKHKPAPPVAPKPKSLPPSAAMVTHKGPVPNLELRTNRLGSSPTERVILDPQQVRREALSKLGLLQAIPPIMTRPRSRSDLHAPTPAPKSATLHQSAEHGPASSWKSCPRARTASLGHSKDPRPHPLDSAAENASQKAQCPKRISMSMAPWNQPSRVRQEALRKLGLLRE
ncbi:hypothetical protein GJAV_G00171250 [Gymnothorax javanicus]|nr:hypothetical protein GJAV_G00171250 [Gymnothorax javanicus]